MRPLTIHDHIHAEAFMLMTYQCEKCGHVERIWNSRDGVTPFCITCGVCKAVGGTSRHINWGNDEYIPGHKLTLGERYFRDGTPDEAEAIVRSRIELFGKEFPRPEEDFERMVQDARSGASPSFEKGWPKLAVYMGDEG